MQLLPPVTDPSTDLPPSYTQNLLPVTQDVPISTQPTTRRTMSHERVPAFSGAGNNEVQPSEFIKIFRRAT